VKSSVQSTSTTQKVKQPVISLAKVEVPTTQSPKKGKASQKGKAEIIVATPPVEKARK
jgi:hypothetical protein